MRDRLRKISEDRDDNAFKSLFLTFSPKVRAMLIRQGADGDTADDIVQETMLAVWSKAHLFTEEKGSLAGWIYTIARNLRIDKIRRQIVWDRFRKDVEQLNSTSTTSADTFEHPQDRARITRALSDLPAEQLQIVQLAFIEGLSHNEIAARLDLPLGTVKSRMRLAFNKLRYTVGGEA